MLSTISHCTNRSASSCSVQPARPSGGWEQASHICRQLLSLGPLPEGVPTLPAPGDGVRSHDRALRASQAVDLLPASQGSLDSLLNTAAAHPFHRGVPHPQGPGYFLVPHGPAPLAFIAEQQYARESVCMLPPVHGTPVPSVPVAPPHQPDPVLLRRHPILPTSPRL